MEEVEEHVIEAEALSSFDGANVFGVNEEYDNNHRRQREMMHFCEFKRRKDRRLELSLTVPSYTLTVGAVNLRFKNRARLQYLLHKLVLQHNWREATGVLSALLKATCHERSPRYRDRSLRSIRMKYSVAMELCRHMESDQKAYSKRIEDLFRTWILKIRSYKNKPFKDRYVLLDHILSSFARNEHSTANDALLSLKRTSDYGRDPVSYLVVGLASYEVWYSGLREEMHERNLEESYVPKLSETVGNSASGLLDDMRVEGADSVNDTCSGVSCHSEASVVNDNGELTAFNQNTDGKASDFSHNPGGKASRNNNNLAIEPLQRFQTQDLSRNTVATLDESIDIMEHKNDQLYCSNSFNVHGLQMLLPFKIPLPEDVVFYSSYKDYYNDAVKYLKVSLQSPPPVSEASLLPLVQLLLLGNQVDEALLVLQQFCNESTSVFPCRLRARLQECLEANDFGKLSSCFEDVIRKDPTCRRSLTRLIDLHYRGEYAPDNLVEMISVHLEATYGDLMIWKEFACCLLKISISDRVSTCINGEQVESEQRRTMWFSTTPVMFKEGLAGKTWKLRSKWWLNRHFSKRVLTSEIEKGAWELMAYKAACASHLYGKDFEYVVKVQSCAKEHNSRNTYLSFLRTHMNNAFGFFSNIVKKKD